VCSLLSASAYGLGGWAGVTVVGAAVSAIGLAGWALWRHQALPGGPGERPPSRVGES
jgi:hypothetical protein